MAAVPFVDFKRLHDPIRAELHEAARRVLDSGTFIGGPEVKGFEAELSAQLDGAGVVGVSCATSGLFSSLRALGVGPGDEVIVPVHTAICTSEAVTLCGAQVVFVDLEPRPGCFNLDPAAVERALSPRTKAIIAVHLYGQPADLDTLLPLAAKHGLPVIEDCAQAQGARYRGRPVGTLAEIGVYSFFPSKNLGGFGDGGAVTARDPAVLRRIRMFSNHGREDKYLHEFEGFNSRLDALQAALLRVCLPHLARWNEGRREAACWYEGALKGIPGLVRPVAEPHTSPVYHLYVIEVPERDRVMAELKAAGIQTGLHYPMALNLQPAYRHLGRGPGSFPRAEAACERVVSLPMHAHLTQREVEAVAAALRRSVRE